MTDTVFVQSEFWALVCLSIGVPALAYGWAARRPRLMWAATCLLGLLMVAVSATDVVLLQVLRRAALRSLDRADDAWFGSEIAIALYAFPILYGGVGVNFISAGLIEHFQRVGPSARAGASHVARRDRASGGRRCVPVAATSGRAVHPARPRVRGSARSSVGGGVRRTVPRRPRPRP